MVLIPFDSETVHSQARLRSFLERVNDKLSRVEAENAALRQQVVALSAPTHNDRIISLAQHELSSRGRYPIPVDGLHGQLAESQVGQLLVFTTDPTTTIDANLYDVGTFATFNGTFYYVAAGNPHIWQGVSLATNVVTTNSNQTIGPGAQKTFADLTKFSAGIELLGSNGALLDLNMVSEETTLSLVGLTTDSAAILLGPNCLLLHVTTRITTGLTGPTATVNVGDATTAQRFGQLATLTAGATAVLANHLKGSAVTDPTGPYNVAGASLRYTANAIPTAGKIRAVVWYIQATPSTS